jgi:hypothetical protein
MRWPNVQSHRAAAMLKIRVRDGNDGVLQPYERMPRIRVP